MPKALTLLFPLLLSLPGCALFANDKPILTAQNVGCSDIVASWMKQVEGAPLPAGDKIEDWMVFSDQQTGRLDMANDRIVNGHATIKRCEDRDEAARVRATKRGFFG